MVSIVDDDTGVGGGYPQPVCCAVMVVDEKAGTQRALAGDCWAGAAGPRRSPSFGDGWTTPPTAHRRRHGDGRAATPASADLCSRRDGGRWW